MKVLLHACCGPCLLEPYDALAAGHDVTVCYANPNIHPAEEYARRRDTLLEYTGEAGITVLRAAVRARGLGGGDGRPRAPGALPCVLPRCASAWRRAEAARRGFDAVATTLTVSPYQDPDAIRAMGEEACAGRA